MVGPQFPGRSPGQQLQQRMREQQRTQQRRRDQMGYAWQQQQRERGRGPMGPRPPRRHGFFARLILGAFELVFSVVVLAAIFFAVYAFPAEDVPTETAVAGVVIGVVALFLRRRVRRARGARRQ